MNSQLELKGIDGSNPLGFLAALGVLRLVDMLDDSRSSRLSWTDEFVPVLETPFTQDTSELAKQLVEGLGEIIKHGVTSLGDIIGVECRRFQEYVRTAYTDRNGIRLQFAAAFGCDAVVDDKKRTIVPNQLSFSNGQGGKLLLKDFQKLVRFVDVKRMRGALFEPWHYEDVDQPTFRWDPLDMRTGAHMATDPGSTETRSVAAANALAFVGLSFLPSVPLNGDLRTTSFRKIDGDMSLTWPLWKSPLGVDAIASLLQQQQWCAAIGIIACFSARRIEYKKNLYLSGATAIDGECEE